MYNSWSLGEFSNYLIDLKSASLVPKG